MRQPWLPTTTSRATSITTRCLAGLAQFHRPIHLRRARVALEAIGNPKAVAETTTYGDVANMVISLPPDGAPGTGRQQHPFEGMPFGTRGGFIVEHNFPADGEYELTIGDMALAREVPRMEFENTVIVLLDGKEFYRTNIGGEADHKAIDQKLDPAVEEINGRLRKLRFKATAGQHKLASRSCIAASPKATSARAPSRSRVVRSASRPRMPCRSAGRSRSPASASRRAARKFFICAPKASREEIACANKIVESLARRVPASGDGRGCQSVDGVYRAGTRRAASTAVCAMPSARSGKPAFPLSRGVREVAGGVRTLSDLELASRLSSSSGAACRMKNC